MVLFSTTSLFIERAVLLTTHSYEALTELGRRQPTRFGGLPFTFENAWRVNVFDTPEERKANLFEPF